MGFGTSFAQKPPSKPKKAEPVRPVTGALVRIVLLATLAIGASAYGIYLYYTHAFTPKPRPAAPADAASSGEIWIDLSPSASGAPK